MKMAMRVVTRAVLFRGHFVYDDVVAVWRAPLAGLVTVNLATSSEYSGRFHGFRQDSRYGAEE